MCVLQEKKDPHKLRLQVLTAQPGSHDLADNKLKKVLKRCV